MTRLFIGWQVPGEVKAAIGSIVRSIRTDLPVASWPRPETYHLTFAFLGDQEEQEVEKLAGVLERRLRETAAAEVRLSAPGFFPSPRKPRVGWLGMEPEEQLVRIAKLVREAMRSESIDLEDKPYHPHLTIARMKARWSRSDVEVFLKSWDSIRDTPLLVDSVTLFESRLGPGGATHIARARIDLN